MTGSTLRRIVPVAVVVLLLLPLASASATPLPRSETSLAIRLADWSRTLLAPASDFLQHLRPLIQADFNPPGQQPGNNLHLDPSPGEGSGLDPHGRP